MSLLNPSLLPTKTNFAALASFFAAATLLSASAAIAAPHTFELKIYNGGAMPISPAVAYAREGSLSASAPGSIASSGFIKLCQMGDAASRDAELRGNTSNSSVTMTSTPIMPGESKTVEVTVQDTKTQSIHFETMYGKTTDICGVASVRSHSLEALVHHVSPAAIVNDRTVVTGAFQEARLPSDYLSAPFCQSASTAIACLRTLQGSATTPTKISAFNGYLPSVLSMLETKYGADEALSLRVPSAGAIEIEVKLKH